LLAHRQRTMPWATLPEAETTTPTVLPTSTVLGSTTRMWAATTKRTHAQRFSTASLPRGSLPRQPLVQRAIRDRDISVGRTLPKPTSTSTRTPALLNG